MKLGFTGTREGLTDAQSDALRELFQRLAPVEFHHGCAIGADTQAHAIMRRALPDVEITGYPSNVDGQRDRLTMLDCDELLPPMPPLVRNGSIVDAVDVLVACPRGLKEEWRSGTWATVRYARKQARTIWLVWPDGAVSEDGR